MGTFAEIFRYLVQTAFGVLLFAVLVRLLLQLARAAERYAPKADKGSQQVRILFGSQIGIAPPTFAVSINHPVDLHFSYRRYLENQIREVFGFEGAPIRIKVRYRRRKPRS